MAEDEPWWKPLEYPPEVETELQKTFGSDDPEGTNELSGAIFRRAILLHQLTGTDGFLGLRGPWKAPRVHNIMVGSLFACRIAKTVALLVDDDPYLRERYEMSESPGADYELMWIGVDLTKPDLQRLLEDENVWAAYERMLNKFPTLSRPGSNHLNIGKMSVLTGKRLGREEPPHGGVDRGPLNLILYGPPGTGKTYSVQREKLLVFARSWLRVVVASTPLRQRISGQSLQAVVSRCSQAVLRRVGVVTGVEKRSPHTVLAILTVLRFPGPHTSCVASAFLRSLRGVVRRRATLFQPQRRRC